MLKSPKTLMSYTVLDSVFELVLKILLRSHSSTSSSHPKGPASYDAKAAGGGGGGGGGGRQQRRMQSQELQILFKILPAIYA